MQPYLKEAKELNTIALILLFTRQNSVIFTIMRFVLTIHSSYKLFIIENILLF